jgi:hypothetical protein
MNKFKARLWEEAAEVTAAERDSLETARMVTFGEIRRELPSPNL